MDNKVFVVFLMSQRVIAVQAFEEGRTLKNGFLPRECGGAYFAPESVLLNHYSCRDKALEHCNVDSYGAINITFRTATGRFDFLAILPFEVRM